MGLHEKAVETADFADSADIQKVGVSTGVNRLSFPIYTVGVIRAIRDSISVSFYA